MDGKLQPEEFKEKILDPISKTFCGSKFLSGTIWLGSGKTASCHHCPAEPVDKTTLGSDPSKLFNTVGKAQSRDLMFNGQRPKECSYCWNTEDQGILSDRTFSSGTFNPESLRSLRLKKATASFLPRQLEIAFDRTCQFSCSYCGPQYSTRWKNDIQTHGPMHIASDTFGQYSDTFNALYSHENGINPFIEAFWNWWPELKMNLEELRITGGEPLLSSQVWRLLEDLALQPSSDLKLAINSNLGFASALMNRLHSLIEKMPNRLSIYTSCEGVGKQAEYIREGLNFAQWKNNVENLLEHQRLRKVVVTMTVGALSLPTLIAFLDLLMEFKNQYGRLALQFSVNELKSPSFQSIRILPFQWRRQSAADLQTWMNSERLRLLTNHEQSGLNSLVGSLLDEKQDFQGQSADFRKFFKEHDLRRGKNFSEVFPEDWTRWFNG